MKKTVLLLFTALFAAVSFLHAQDLIKKIPANATMVGTIQTPKMMQLMSADDLSGTTAIKKLFENFTKESGKEIKNIKETGIDLTANTYFFRAENDSVAYNCLLIPVANNQQFASTVETKNGTIQKNGISISYTGDSSSVLVWDTKHAVIVTASLKYNYFDKKEIAERYGLSYYDYGTYSTTDSAAAVATPPDADSTVTEVEVVEAPAVEEEVRPADPYFDSSEEAEQKVKESFEISTYDKDYAIKKTLGINWSALFAQALIQKEQDSSVIMNSNYTRIRDDNAVAVFWINNPMNLSLSNTPFYGYNRYSAGTMLFGANMANSYGYKSLVSKIFMDNETARMVTDVEMTPESAAFTQKIYNRPLNKQFLKYIHADSLLGYMAWSLDTKSYLEEIPRFLEKTYSSFAGKRYADEMILGAEFFSLLLDEEAVSQLYKGDAMLILNGVYQQKVTYTDYIYDDNFKATPVEKTKTERLPKFLFMFSSEEQNFTAKLIKYGIKKNILKQQGVFYEFTDKRSPVHLYFMQKDGMFFFTNAEDDLQKIAAGNYAAKFSKAEKKFLMNGNFTFFFNPQRTAKVINDANIEVKDVKEFSTFVQTIEKMGNVYIKALPMQNNTFTYEINMKSPQQHGNAMRYMFNIIDGFMQ